MTSEGVDNAHHLWLAAMEANDPAALGRLATADVVLMPPHDQPVVGQQAVVDWFSGIVSQARTKAVAILEREVIVAGDVAIERGSFTWTVAPVGGSDIQDRGSFLAVWRRQPDGSWKVARNIWNSMLPLPAIT